MEATRESQRSWREEHIATGRLGGLATQEARRKRERVASGASSKPTSDASSEPPSEKQALHSSVFSLHSS
jgi:hypothetical protein